MIARYPLALCALVACVLLPGGCGVESAKAVRHAISHPAVIEAPSRVAAPARAPVIEEEIADMSLG
ncbi:MAG TPA: hypothetical protein VN929_06940 [Burkholderiales bacterium]|nr:hypothetical protein [Burkholderiales bacterium]